MEKIIKKLKKIAKAKKSIIFLVLIISRGATVRSSPLRWIAKIPLLILFWLLKDHVFDLITYATNIKHLKPRKKPRNIQTPFRLFYTKVLLGDKSTTTEKYCTLLSNFQPLTSFKYDLMHRFLSAGRLDLAKVTAIDLINRKQDEFVWEKRLAIYRDAGVICFLLGQNKEANAYWKLAGEFRKTLFKPTTPTKYRILGTSWFVAIGHVAMLDYYLKYKRLYQQKDHRIVAANPGLHANLGCAADLMQKFSELGIMILGENELEEDYNQWAQINNAPKWQQLSPLEQEAMIDDFWEYEFPDGAILSYTHAAARIQKEWKQTERPPLLAITKAEKKWLETFLNRLGMPSNAWFVCLHVREAGFHRQWNSKLPAMRDSEIVDYYPAIQKIVNAGGWVLRMGDPSMKIIPSMPNVIDYAHSLLRTPIADMLLAASCRFFLGTNSGFATIPAIYGVPCALTNWVPLGWPLWPNQDLMICKLFREKTSKRFLSLEEIFKRGLAFLQNRCDLPEDIELVANTPEDISRLTLEMLWRYTPNKHYFMEVEALAEVQNCYSKIASKYETFTGSRFAGSFIKNYPEVFTFSEMKKNIKYSERIISQVQENVSRSEALR